jgi:hypothetical protein
VQRVYERRIFDWLGAFDRSCRILAVRGGFIWREKSEEDDADIDDWPSISPSYTFEKFMAFSRFKDFRRFFPSIYPDKSRKETDIWWQFSGAVDEFNLIKTTKLTCSHWISVD